jgi:hypothetical protein
MKIGAAIVAVVAQTSSAFALTCFATVETIDQKRGPFISSKNANKSIYGATSTSPHDMKINLSNGRFIWIGGLDQQKLEIYIMRPTTAAEAAESDERFPPTVTSEVHVSAKREQLRSPGLKLVDSIIKKGKRTLRKTITLVCE